MGINIDSVLGQVISNTMGIVVNKYLRVLESGDNNSYRNIYTYNLELDKYFGINKLVIAEDIWGELYGINKESKVTGENDFYDGCGTIWYFSSDKLSWNDTMLNYPGFIEWIGSNSINTFYKKFI